MLIKKYKKGEITTQEIVILIVLIISFAIILFLIFRLNLGGTTNSEICKNSVILRAKTSLSGPINCKTDYLCISGGQSCPSFSASETITTNSNNKTQIMQAIADEMSNCWSEFGEGKIDYGEGTTRVDYAICGIVSFDKTIQKQIPTITYQEFYTFLQKTKKDSTTTYLQYLYGVTNLASFSSQPQIKVSISSDEISTTQQYSVITGVDNNLISKDKILGVYIIPTAETSSRLVSDRNFITIS